MEGRREDILNVGGAFLLVGVVLVSIAFGLAVAPWAGFALMGFAMLGLAVVVTRGALGSGEDQ